ncbi:MAG TPA: alanine racemase [Candidatus Obscuribacterales bacterium]
MINGGRGSGWEPPFVQPHRLGEINKFGHRSVRDDYVSEIFGASIPDLIREFGSPLFVTSENQIRSNIRRIMKAFETRYDNVVHGWSYKTNYISAVCNILHQEGSWAEVVSSFEYEKARALGVPGNKIIFNGPNKPKAILERAIAEGAHIHVDHLNELHMIEAIARQQQRVVPVTLRLNFDTGFTEPWSRFGFNVETGQAHQAARLVSLSPHVRLIGLHSHIGTFILEPRAYAEQVRVMCKLMRELETNEDIFIEVLDIGGGFPSKNSLQRIYLPPEQIVPDVNQFADAICGALLEETQYRRQTGRPFPRLVFESGRAVVDDAQVLLATVVGTKRLPDGRRAAILDGGTNLLFTAYWYNHNVKMTKPTAGPLEDTVLYGPLCMNIDVVRYSVQLPPLSAGDVLMVSPVGAYNNTQWLQFIEYRPNVVLVDETGEVSVIRQAEDLSVMMSQDRLPDHLRQAFLEDNAPARAHKLKRSRSAGVSSA